MSQLLWNAKLPPDIDSDGKRSVMLNLRVIVQCEIKSKAICCADAQDAEAEAAFLREQLIEESELAREQIAELEARARVTAAERDALLEKARNMRLLLRCLLYTCSAVCACTASSIACFFQRHCLAHCDGNPQL